MIKVKLANLTYSQALESMKEGELISRAGWNGKEMFLWIKKGSVPPEKLLDAGTPEATYEGIASDLFEQGGEGTVTRLPTICMKVATGSTLEGWLASQTDQLASDWCVVETE